MTRTLIGAVVIAGVVALRPLGAQVRHTPAIGPPRAEARVDLVAGRPLTVQAGGGILWPIGRNVMLGVVAGAGTSRARIGADDDAPRQWHASARGEIVARFVIDRRDPGAWRPYGVAGAGMLGMKGASPLPRVFVGIGVEPDLSGRGVRPAIEIGVGGGLRAGIALRQSARREP